jgi:uncharacterized protein
MARFQNDDLSALNLRKLNLRHFCRDGLDLRRELGLDDLPRVRESLSTAAQDFQLQAQGLVVTQRNQRNDGEQLQLVLHVKGSVPLVCQRCLERVDIAVDSQARFVLVANEAEADAMERIAEGAQEESSDVLDLNDLDDLDNLDNLDNLDKKGDIEPLVADKPIDLIALAEDEILLSLPLVPMHEVCPQPIAATSTQALEFEEAIEAKKPNPFAVLASLKKH